MESINVRRQIFEFIVDYHKRWNCDPRRSEICKIFSGLSDDVNLHLEQLAREGLLRVELGGEQITLSKSCAALKLIKLHDGLRDGTSNTIAIDLQAVGVNMAEELCARVIGDDSMIDAGLRPKDIAIVRSAAPGSGEIVSAEIGGRLVFRRYLIIKGIPHLLAENPRQPDLSAAFDVPLLGVLCCVISPRFKSTADSALRETQKVNYTRGAAPTHKRTQWPAPPSGINLNDEVGASYSTAQWNRTSEDPPEQPYDHSRSQKSTKSTTGSCEDGVATDIEKGSSKRFRASDAQPIKSPVPETPKSKRIRRVSASLRV